MKLKFTKMQAFGNDYVYMDAIRQTVREPQRLAVQISDRHFGVGSDGLVLLCPSESCAFRMRMFNPDGSEGEMCGNALRSLAKFAYYHHFTEETEFTVETLGGVKLVKLEVRDGQVVNIEADIGQPQLCAAKVPAITEGERFLDLPLTVEDRKFRATALSWGNPHCVIFLDEDLDGFDVKGYGRKIEHMTEVFPKKTNVTFCRVIDDSHLKIREWERGTGETMGCATGCCTAVVAGHLLGLCGRSVLVEQPGGVLQVEWKEQGQVLMRGPSEIVFEGEYIYEA